MELMGDILHMWGRFYLTWILSPILVVVPAHQVLDRNLKMACGNIVSFLSLLCQFYAMRCKIWGQGIYIYWMLVLDQATYKLITIFTIVHFISVKKKQGNVFNREWPTISCCYELVSYVSNILVQIPFSMGKAYHLTKFYEWNVDEEMMEWAILATMKFCYSPATL